MTVKESRTAILLETNVKTSVDKFLRISQNANVELTREGMGKSVTQPKGDSIQVENRSNNLKKTRGYPYILCYKIEVANLFCMPLVSGCEQKLFRLYFSCTERKAVMDALSPVATILLLKKSQKCFFFLCYHLQVVLRSL